MNSKTICRQSHKSNIELLKLIKLLDPNYGFSLYDDLVQDIEKIIELQKQLFEDLRISVKYSVFNKEALERENAFLRELISKRKQK